MSKSATRTVDQLSFEEAMTELEQIVRDMELGKTGLEQSIEQYERGVALRDHCQKRLQEAQMRITQMTQQADGILHSETTTL
jgi:exodeoxyribonuclease VII small subunit